MCDDIERVRMSVLCVCKTNEYKYVCTIICSSCHFLSIIKQERDKHYMDL
jgi:hypothetical protein